MSLFRTRWAAIGAAVAVGLGGGAIAIVSATSPTGAVAFVPITPCRVLDTRPTDQVGPRSAPLGTNDTHTVDAISTTDEAGQCAGTIPAGATAISMNVTTVGATAGTFLTIWEADVALPDASSLNPQPGQPPTPNAVTTSINDDGEFSIYNLAGNVHVLADINGYYTDHDHDDRYYTKSQIDGRGLTRVVAQGFVVPTDKDLIRELAVAPRVGVTATLVDVGRVVLDISGVDTADAPIVMVLPQRVAGAGSCQTSLLSTQGPNDYRVRVDCHDSDGLLASTPFQFVVTD